MGIAMVRKTILVISFFAIPAAMVLLLIAQRMGLDSLLDRFLGMDTESVDHGRNVIGDHYA